MRERERGGRNMLGENVQGLHTRTVLYLNNWYCAPDKIRVIIHFDKVGIPVFVIIYSSA
jgi:hypothetical protein